MKYIQGYNPNDHLQKVLFLFFEQILLSESHPNRLKAIKIFTGFFNLLSITPEKSLYLPKINGITVLRWE
jgi:hypothetical protein